MSALKKLKKLYHTIVVASFNLGKVPEELGRSHLKATTACEKIEIQFTNYCWPAWIWKYRNHRTEIEDIPVSIKFSSSPTESSSSSVDDGNEEESHVFKNIPDIFILIPQLKSGESEKTSSSDELNESIPQIDVTDDYEGEITQIHDIFYSFSQSLLSLKLPRISW